MDSNYRQISSKLLASLAPRVKDVILRRFGLESGKEETLEAIGKDLGITRERVRQIEESGLEKIRPEIKKYQKFFDSFFVYIKSRGGLKKESLLLEEMGGEKNQRQVYFLLSLDKRFKRLSESENFHSLWTIDDSAFTNAKKTIDMLSKKLDEVEKPLLFKEIKALQAIGDDDVLLSYLEISKNIQKNSDGLYGMKDWPEINPKGIKDKAYLVFKKTGKPLHFTDVAKLINGSLTQTVHNELIRDVRFVLVGRGIYALSEWGYEPGQVKDILVKILKDSKRPLTKDEVLNQVLKQRMVKENTVFLNLGNKNYFQRNSEGRYKVRES
jgi:hypothetical protein